MTKAGARLTRVLTPEQRMDMVHLWASGVHSEVVARRYGVHEAYVRKQASRYGVKSVFHSGHGRRRKAVLA